MKIEQVEIEKVHESLEEGSFSNFKPHKWNVVFENDDVTPEGFVSLELVEEYGYSEPDAISKTVSISRSGRGVIGTFYKSIAEEKAKKTISKARKMGYPLQVKVEIADEE